MREIKEIPLPVFYADETESCSMSLTCLSPVELKVKMVFLELSI